MVAQPLLPEVGAMDAEDLRALEGAKERIKKECVL
jgi:hypothetical protein